MTNRKEGSGVAAGKAKVLRPVDELSAIGPAEKTEVAREVMKKRRGALGELAKR